MLAQDSAALCSYVLQVLAFPVQMLVRFWVNHHLLDLVQRPCWRVVKGRSKSYVDKVLAGEAKHSPSLSFLRLLSVSWHSRRRSCKLA